MADRMGISRSAQFAIRFDLVKLSGCTVVFSTELGIRLSFVKNSEFLWGRGGLNPQPPSVRHCCDYFTFINPSALVGFLNNVIHLINAWNTFDAKLVFEDLFLAEYYAMLTCK
jgi:hypothetical protein